MRAPSRSHVWLFATPWISVYQAPLSMEFSRQVYWSGLPFPLPGISPSQGSNPHLLCLMHWQVDSLPTAPSCNRPPADTKSSFWLQRDLHWDWVLSLLQTVVCRRHWVESSLYVSATQSAIGSCHLAAWNWPGWQFSIRISENSKPTNWTF